MSPLLFKVEFNSVEAISSPSSAPLQEPDVAVLLPTQSLGKAAMGWIHEQHAAVCIAAAIAAGKSGGRGGL